MVNRVRKLSMEILDKYEESFGGNFEDNKKTLSEVSTITSKELKNEIAGFITKTIKRGIRERQKREADQRAREEEAAELARAEADEQTTDAVDSSTEEDTAQQPVDSPAEEDTAQQPAEEPPAQPEPEPTTKQASP